ncbi:pentapeptide repeat-containing protein [Cylindrospermum sp. NIES-4074]|nr:pentapeptide repeat-containing protein [Cylindrospermum sp. NIES-4074]
MYKKALVTAELIKPTANILSRLLVISHAYYMTKGSLSMNHSPLAKILMGIMAIPEKFKQVQRQYHKLPKQRLKTALTWLRNNKIDTNLVAINNLEQIAHNHPQYHWVIMDILTQFIRNNSPYLPQEEISSYPTANIRIDIQAAITVIGRRDINRDPENEQLDLSHTDLRGVNLNGANLKQTNLYHTNLSGANLAGVNLSGAILSAANLSKTNLNQANLSGAILSAANLDGANLSDANLQRANLYLARLEGAILNDTLLKGANLREVQFSR